ncbi:hypothetical protein AMECASPLE_008763 [Ameca splendens]|uniref:Uncharacterized protein n=1 Tax=Ameca splendens TaxID=208324 RepID=A0ABV0YC03_9TELE
MHGPIYSKLNMVDLSQPLSSSIELHLNLAQRRPLRHFNSSSSLMPDRIHLKLTVHHHGSMLDMLTQSIHYITLAPPTNKQMSVASIWKVRFTPNFKCFSPDDNSA